MGRKSINASKNALLYKYYYDYLKSLVVNRFDWDGLPDNINSYHIENYLCDKGQTLFFNDNMLGFMCLPVNFIGGVNVHGESNLLQAVGIGYYKTLSRDESVIIYNNLIRKSSHDLISIYAKKLFDIDNVMSININGQKTPYIMVSDANSLLSLKNLYQEITDNEPVIYADKMLDINNFNVFPTIAPYVTDKLRTEKNNIINEFLTVIGINNANTEKKERLIESEVNSNNEFIMYNVYSLYDARLKACEEINNMFNLNVSVNIKEVEPKEQNNIIKEV